MLTTKQKELLMFIHERLKETGVPPSFDEMKEALDLKSKSGIHRLITALEERGFVRRLPHRARALEIVRLPEVPSSAGSDWPRPQASSPSVIEGSRPAMSRVRPPPREAPEGLHRTRSPCHVIGRIAAGEPIDGRPGRVPEAVVGSAGHCSARRRAALSPSR